MNQFTIYILVLAFTKIALFTIDVIQIFTHYFFSLFDDRKRCMHQEEQTLRAYHRVCLQKHIMNNLFLLKNTNSTNKRKFCLKEFYLQITGKTIGKTQNNHHTFKNISLSTIFMLNNVRLHRLGWANLNYTL